MKKRHSNRTPSGQPKDYYEKKLEDFDDVFADIFNVLIFHGDQRIQEKDLQTGMTRSAIGDTFFPQERDSKKSWKNSSVVIAILGLENQTGEDPDFPIRILTYDAADYRDQIHRRTAIRRENAKRRKKRRKRAMNQNFLKFRLSILW